MVLYSVPPAGARYEYPTMISPRMSSGGGPQYYQPMAYQSSPVSPRPRHTRTASYAPPKTALYDERYSTPNYYPMSSNRSSPSAVTPREFVSREQHPQIRPTTMRRSSVSSSARPSHYRDNKPFAAVRTANQTIFIDISDRPHNDSSGSEDPIYVLAEPRLGRKTSTSKRTSILTLPTRSKADSKVYQMSPSVDTPTRSRARRSSTVSKSTTPKHTETVTPKATAQDAADRNIPAGYCLKNWDPNEKEILLLGSVFDANSLGKWIYDWTIYANDPGHPLTEFAGELWVMLIKFGTRYQRAKRGIERVKYEDDRVELGLFLREGDRVWRKLDSLIKTCESVMWDGVSTKASGKVMGKESGVAFVDTLFGRDGEMHKTERLTESMRKLNLHFESECDGILRALKKK